MTRPWDVDLGGKKLEGLLSFIKPIPVRVEFEGVLTAKSPREGYEMGHVEVGSKTTGGRHGTVLNVPLQCLKEAGQ